MESFRPKLLANSFRIRCTVELPLLLPEAEAASVEDVACLLAAASDSSRLVSIVVSRA